MIKILCLELFESIFTYWRSKWISRKTLATLLFPLLHRKRLWLLLNKMVLIKSFLTGVSHDCSKSYIHIFEWSRSGVQMLELFEIDFFIFFISYFYIKHISLKQFYSLHKICENAGFHWPVFSCIRTESRELNERTQVSQNPYSRIFYAVIDR